MNQALQHYRISDRMLNYMLIDLITQHNKILPPIDIACFRLLISTGCRVSELSETIRDFNQHESTFTIYSQKNDVYRTFDKSVLGLYYIELIDFVQAQYWTVSLDRLRDYMREKLPTNSLTVGFKQVRTHIFRHNYVRQKLIDGSELEDIAKYDLKIKLSSIQTYAYSPIRATMYPAVYEELEFLSSDF